MSAHLQLTDEHIMIRDAAADFLASRCDSIALRKTVDAAFAGQGDGVDAALWQAFGQELGYCGLSLPEEVGGLNLGMTALTLVMEQLGKRLAPMPFFQSSVLAAGVLQYACESAGAQSYLEALASGEQTASLLMDANAGSSDAIFGAVSAKADGAHYLLSGQIAQVFASASSDFFLVSARLSEAQEPAIFVLPQGTAGLSLKPIATWDCTRPLMQVQLASVKATAAQRLGKGDKALFGIFEALPRANLALAAEALGGAQQVLDLTLAYCAERVQFGRTIASYQAIKHRAAQMMVKIEALRSGIAGAAAAWDSALTDAARRAAALDSAAARLLAEDAYFYCAADSIQLHGGVGFTWEFDPHLYFRRAQASSQRMGTVEQWREQIAARLLDEPEEQVAEAA